MQASLSHAHKQLLKLGDNGSRRFGERQTISISLLTSFHMMNALSGSFSSPKSPLLLHEICVGESGQRRCTLEQQRDHQDARAHWAEGAGHNGGASHMPQWEQVSFTNNTSVGTSLTSMGQAVGTSSNGAASHAFDGQNHISSVWGNDREILNI